MERVSNPFVNGSKGHLTYFPLIFSHPATLPCTPALIGPRHSQVTIRLPSRADLLDVINEDLILGLFGDKY